MDEYVSFSGGGTVGVSYLGVIDALEDFHDLECRAWPLRGVAGTSAGSIAALSVVLGLDRANRRRISGMFGDMQSLIPCPNIHMLWNQFGLDNGTLFKTLVDEMLVTGGLSKSATLSDLRRLLRMDFVCLATNVATCHSVVLRAETFPGMLVRDAIFASCCLPFIFAPHDEGGVRMVDGCLAQNLPHVFDAVRTLFVGTNPTGRVDPTNLIGFMGFVIRCTTLKQFHADRSVVPGIRTIDVTVEDTLRGRVDVQLSDSSFAMLYTEGYVAATSALRRMDVRACVGHVVLTICTTSSCTDE